MNDLNSIATKYNLSIRSYQEIKQIKIIDTNRGKFVLKEKFRDNDKLYEYLNNKKIDFFLEKYDINNYDIYPYIEQIDIPKEDKAMDLVYILSILHNKTLYYKSVVLDDVKKMYEALNEKIDNINKYYFDMQDIIEQKVYPSPEEYLLIRNVSLIYSSLTFSKNKLKEWYEYKKEQKKERIVLLHNKPSLDHFLISNKKILISWDNYKRDIPIYDFLNLYKENYKDVEMASLFDIYQSKFPYTNDEYLLFLVLISIPDKVIFTRHHFYDCRKVYYMINYLNKTRDFISKENEKYQCKDKDEFKK